MSKENTNFRLLGSPVNLSYRNKKKEGKNSKNRPRSALQNSCTRDNLDRLRRPYSADTKETGPSTRSLKTFSADLLQSYSNSPLTVKILPPTEELLNNSNINRSNKDMCSNASDYGSEDTFISLGTQIKAKAQSSSKSKTTNPKNFLKYRNIARKGRKMETGEFNKRDDNYEFDIRITEKRAQSSSSSHYSSPDYRTSSPTFKSRNNQLNFLSYDGSLNADVSDTSSFSFNTTGVQRTIENYTRYLTKQHLSLVEEESTHDLESMQSQRATAENSCMDEHQITTKPILLNYEKNVMNEENPKGIKFNEVEAYNMFYEDIHGDKSRMSSTYIPTDASSKDSGYPDSITKDDKRFVQSFSLPNETLIKNNNTNNSHEKSKSFNNLKHVGDINSIPVDNSKWVEPLNHSRLLYKDFFLKKEGHLAIPPNNSPVKNGDDISGNSECLNRTGQENEKFEYPSYLVNSSTKAYTSKVIEDYKKEIEAINNLHELTLKDIKTDAISPTPLSIDVMFEQHSHTSCDDIKDVDNSQRSSNVNTVKNSKNSMDKNRQNASKVSTKELIQNYFKVKGDYKDIEALPKNQKYDKKLKNITSKYLNILTSNKSYKHSEKASTVPASDRNQKNAFTLPNPSSARFESVQNDKDVESWMSLAAPSPTTLGTNHKEELFESTSEKETQPTEETVQRGSAGKQTPIDQVAPKTNELTSKSSVLDIYTMLNEIESYGEKPVAAIVEVDATLSPPENAEMESTTPKNNFTEIFDFLEEVEQSANDALSVVTNTTPQNTPKLESLLKLPQTELAQRLVTASLQLEERSCCIALLQESLTNHKHQMISKVNNLEKQSQRGVARVKQECEDTIKRHQSFIDQLINDKKTLNHRIEQLVDERRSLEERWKRSAQSLEERYKLELRNQHDKMAAAQQELTVKGLEGELREMADRQQQEISDLKVSHAEQTGRLSAKHTAEMEELRRSLEEEKEVALVKERQLASARMEKQILELELTYQEQRTRLVSEMSAENERAARELAERERRGREDIAKWKEEQEKMLEEKRCEMESEMARDRARFEEQLKQTREELRDEFERYKSEFEGEQQVTLKRKVSEITAQHKLERDREIEKAIESMETEAQAGRRELQDALRRNKGQYEAELKELGETEKATLKRYQDAQARIRQTEDRCAELESQVGQLETRNRLSAEKNSQLECRAEEVRASCEETWRSKLDALQRKMEENRKTHEEQMHQLYAKVKVAVARKDSAIQALTREAGKYQEKITLLEQKLQQQRKDFLKSK